MSETPAYPQVYVAVALIKRDSDILVAYNPRWGSYSLPMSKLREWEDPGQKDGKQKESWADAAARAAGEWIAETFYLEPQARFALIEIQQSDRDEKWKQYHFQVFQIDAQRDTKLSPGARIEWLSPDDILDPNRRPISDTARMLVQRIIDMIQEAKRL